MTRFYPVTVDLEGGNVNPQDVCAVEWAAYKQALDRVIDLDPDRPVMAGARHPVARLDEAALALGLSGPQRHHRPLLRIPAPVELFRLLKPDVSFAYNV